MTLATAHVPPAEQTEPEVAPERPYRMSLDLYERIAELGLIRPEEHVVLLDGMLVQIMTKGSEHSSSLYDVYFVFIRSTPEGWHARQEQPIALRGGPQGDSAPEPDVAVVIGPNSDYRRRQPDSHEVALVVEVASSAAAFRTERAGLFRYAFVGIPAAFIVGLHDQTIHVYTEPSGPSDDPKYGRVEVKRPGELFEVSLRNLPGQPPAILGPIAVASFFPPSD